MEFKQPWANQEIPAIGTKRDTNADRTMKRLLNKHQGWGKLYWAEIPVMNPVSKAIDNTWLAFLLPHEWLADYFWQSGAKDGAMPARGTFHSDQQAKIENAWRNPRHSMVVLGLHGDGVPVQGRMNQSTCEFLSLNLRCSKLHSQLSAWIQGGFLATRPPRPSWRS